MRTLVNSSIDYEDFVVPVELGGTGAPSLSLAAQNLKMATLSQKGQPGGPIPIGSNGLVDPSVIPALAGMNKVNIQGNFSLVVGEVVTWFITDFDIKKSYAITAKYGTLVRNNEVLLYTAPANPVAEIINIAGREIQFNVKTSTPVRPSILTPTNGSTGVTGPVGITSSPFVSKGAADTHASSDIQISSDPNFTSLIIEGVADPVNKISWSYPLSTYPQPTQLLYGSNFYVRIRHRGTSGNVSDWSNPSIFKTATSFLSVNEVAKVSQSDKSSSDFLGWTLAQDATNTRVVASAPNSSPSGVPSSGSVYVFISSSGVWSQEAKLTPSVKTPSAVFGISLAMSSDGTMLLIGAQGEAKSVAGRVIVFNRNGTTWTEGPTITPNDTSPGDLFGSDVALSTQDSLRMIVGACSVEGGFNGNFKSGSAYIFRRPNTSSNTWTQEAKLVASDSTSNRNFGISVAMSSTGTRVVVGDNFAEVRGIAKAGAAYVFVRTGTAWSQEAILTASDASFQSNFGLKVSSGDNCDRVIVASNNIAPTGKEKCGAAYIYTRTNSAWVQTAVISPPDGVAGDTFGYSTGMAVDSTWVAIGATRASNGKGVKTGAVYIFLLVNGVWVYQGKVSGSDGKDGDSFGWSLSVSRNGKTVTGAVLNSPAGTAGVGAAYILA